MNRTLDGRIIDQRIIINKTLLKKLLTDIKTKRGLSWIKIAKILNVSVTTLRHGWLKKGSTIPLTSLNLILSLGENDNAFLNNIKTIEPFWGQKIVNGKNKSKIINVPNKFSEDFAEFYGIMLGDGCLFSNLKGLSITADRILEKDYFTRYISELIFRLFKLYPHFYFTKNTRTIRCVMYSQNLVKYFSKIGFPIGLKTDLHIPKFITKNRKSLIKCLRGIMDTDGSLSAHPHSKIMIHLSITSETLKEEVAAALRTLQIKPGVFRKGIMLYSQNAIKFCEIIGFSNLKNKIKYSLFVKEGRVPKSKQVESFIRAHKS